LFEWVWLAHRKDNELNNLFSKLGYTVFVINKFSPLYKWGCFRQWNENKKKTKFDFLPIEHSSNNSREFKCKSSHYAFRCIVLSKCTKNLCVTQFCADGRLCFWLCFRQKPKLWITLFHLMATKGKKIIQWKTAGRYAHKLETRRHAGFRHGNSSGIITRKIPFAPSKKRKFPFQTSAGALSLARSTQHHY